MGGSIDCAAVGEEGWDGPLVREGLLLFGFPVLILDRSLSFSAPKFPICKMRIIVLPYIIWML